MTCTPARSSSRCCARTWTWAGRRTSSCCSAAASETRGHSDPPPGGGFKTKIDRYCDLVTLNVFYKSSRLKQYLKDGVALRIETVINSPKDLRCNRQLHNLPELQGKARAINARLLETETVGQGTALVSPVIERITRPTLTGDGRKAPALRFGDLRVQALAGAIAAMLFTVTGITNRTLRGLMTGLLNRPYSMNQASYDLARLARNGLIARVPGRNRYTLTRDGLLFACFYTRVYDHVLRPLMAPDRPNAPPELAAALATLDQLVAEPHRQGPRPHRSLTSRHSALPAARPPSRLPQREPVPLPAVTLRTNVKDVAPKVP